MPRLRALVVAAWLAPIVLPACARSTTERESLAPLQTVAHVDLSRYLGTWYEIASYPQRFQKGCTATTANYTLREDGTIRVLNTCRKDTLGGQCDQAEGRARVVDAQTNAKLEVSFFRPFWGDYWVIDLDDGSADANYEFAVVGHPGRDYLWILSRTPQMDAARYDAILQRLVAKHYDTSRLVRTLQPTPAVTVP